MKPLNLFSWAKWQSGRYKAKIIVMPGAEIKELFKSTTGELVAVTTDRKCFLVSPKRVFLIALREEPSVP